MHRVVEAEGVTGIAVGRPDRPALVDGLPAVRPSPMRITGFYAWARRMVVRRRSHSFPRSRTAPFGAPGAAVAARYDAPYRPRRARRATLLHPLRMVPHVAAATVVATVAVPATAIGWVSALTTGRVPRPVGELLTGVQRYYARLNGSLYLLTDVYPSWSARPGTVELVIDPRIPDPGRREALRRMTEAPPMLARNVGLGVVVLPSAAVAWATAVVTGRMPHRLHRTIALGTSYHARSSAYMSLLTEVVPRVRERDPTTGAPQPSGRGGV